MRIEFGTIGNGTNVQVTLIDEQEPGWGIVDRFYTSDHHISLRLCPDAKMKAVFARLEDKILAPPIVSDLLGLAHLHPYWAERKARKAARLSSASEPAAGTNRE